MMLEGLGLGLTIILLGMIIALVGGFLLLGSRGDPNAWGGMAVLAVGLVIACVGFVFLTGNRNAEKVSEWDQAKTGRYTFYLNDEKINPDDYDPTNYIVAYDDYRQEVYLKEKG